MYYLRTTRFDAWIVMLTAISAVAVSVEFCVLIGVFLSFVLYVPQAARVHFTELTLTPERVVRERLADDIPCPHSHLQPGRRILLRRLPGAGTALGRNRRGRRNGSRVVVLRLKRVRNPDAVCMSVLDRFIERMHDRDVTVLFCGVRPT